MTTKEDKVKDKNKESQNSDIEESLDIEEDEDLECDNSALYDDLRKTASFVLGEYRDQFDTLRGQERREILYDVKVLVDMINSLDFGGNNSQ